MAQTPATPGVCARRIDLSSSLLSDSRRALERALMLTAPPEQSYLFRASSLPQMVCVDYAFAEGWKAPRTDGGFDLLPAEASLHGNSAYPRSVNDGGAWRGVGLNVAATAGARASWRFLNAQLSPEVYYHQNKDFDFVEGPGTGGRSVFGNPYQAAIDLPTRMGANAFEEIMPGQSWLQATYGNVSVTAGTENLWIGAAEVYPLILSYTAPGFPHVRIGTQKPLDLRWVNLEFQVVMASVKESKYFDIARTNDEHYFTVTAVNIEPKFLPGLFLGFARAYHDTLSATGHGPGFYISRTIEGPFGAGGSGNRVGNSIAALYGRWVHPASGFEAYVEWGREDTPGGWIDVLREPDWTQAYVLGFQKAFGSASRLTRLYGELIHLGESAPSRAGRGFFSYYTHSIVRQGHTNQGQLLGAAIGPGSDAQLVGVDLFGRTGRTAFMIERTRYDDDTYYRTFARRFGETRHDAEITLSASRLQFIRGFEIEAGLAYSKRYGRMFMPRDEQPAINETNIASRLMVNWRPSFF